MAAKRGPRDVCPFCMEHREQIPTPYGEKHWRLFRCGGCGHVHRYCELRFNDADEAEKARERKLARRREYAAEHREQRRRSDRIRYINEGFAKRRKLRKRYASDPEYRKEKIEYARKYAEEHGDRRREIARAYYHRHREEILYKQNAAKLRKLRREGRCDSAT